MITLSPADTLAGIAGTATAITATIFGMELNAGVETYKRLAQSQLGLAAATLYTAPAATQAFVKAIHLANVTANPVGGISLFNGGTATTNQITGTFTIPANGFAIIDDSGMQVYDANGNLILNGTISTSAGLAALSSDVGPITTTETQIIFANIASGSVKAGTTYRIKAWGTGTTGVAPGTSVFSIRIGQVSLSVPQLLTVTVTDVASKTGAWYCEFVVTFRGAGAAVIVESAGKAEADGTTTLFTPTVNINNPIASAATNMNIPRIIELTLLTGAASSNKTVKVANIELVQS
jgi:hypothetical protein